MPNLLILCTLLKLSDPFWRLNSCFIKLNDRCTKSPEQLLKLNLLICKLKCSFKCAFKFAWNWMIWKSIWMELILNWLGKPILYLISFQVITKIIFTKKLPNWEGGSGDINWYFWNFNQNWKWKSKLKMNIKIENEYQNWKFQSKLKMKIKLGKGNWKSIKSKRNVLFRQSQLYVSHVCKRIFKFKLQLISYWQNVKFSRYCPKFHIFTKIVIFQVFLTLFRPNASSLYNFYGRGMSGILFFIFASCEPLKECDCCVESCSH